MKLKTTAEEISVLAGKLPQDRWLYDAAAAHALMQAIDEIGTRGIQDADEITNRADELMRSWGFDTREDA